MQCSRLPLTVFLMVLTLCVTCGSVRAENAGAMDEARMDAVVKFASTVLEHGRDTYGAKSSPLFVDGLHVETLRSPPSYPHYSGRVVQKTVMCNFAYQQNLLRVLVGTSRLSGDERYRRAAAAATRYMFERFQEPKGGLLYWGMHRYLDLRDYTIVGEKGDVHELKEVHPFFDFLLEVEPQKAEFLVKGMWNAHIRDWPQVIFTRHGNYDRSFDPVTVWDRPYTDPPAAPKAIELTFLCSAADLMLANYALFRSHGDRKAYEWADRLLERYVRARGETTKILPYLCTAKSRPRCIQQFPGHPNAYENNLLVRRYLADSSIGRVSIGLLREAERLARAGHRAESERILTIIGDHLEGYARHAYDAERGEMRPLIIDGTTLSGFRLAADGYIGRKGEVLDNWPADDVYVSAYAVGYRLTRREALWAVLRSLCRGNGLGDIGATPGSERALDLDTKHDRPRYVFALVELFRATGDRAFLEFAEIVANNLLRNRYHPASGLFTLDRKHLVCPLDSL